VSANDDDARAVAVRARAETTRGHDDI
jgi:hypothetical protein